MASRTVLVVLVVLVMLVVLVVLDIDERFKLLLICEHTLVAFFSHVLDTIQSAHSPIMCPHAGPSPWGGAMHG